jgi:hypothetical protein
MHGVTLRAARQGIDLNRMYSFQSLLKRIAPFVDKQCAWKSLVIEKICTEVFGRSALRKGA